MASPLPDNIFGTAFQRFAYNIDLIEKRYANKRPSGLELDVDTGKIIQVVDAKRPRLTAEEAKEKMRTTFLAPQSLLGNSSLCSPYVNDMNVSRETKLRILKHNKRFKQQLENGYDCSTFLTDENGNNNAEDDDEENGDDENRVEEELFDMDDILDDDDMEEDDDDDEKEEDEDDNEDEEEEENDIKNELSENEEEEDIGPSDKQELEAELDNEKKNEEDLPFEEPEEESANEENTYKNLKITRALIHRLHVTPKVSRKSKKTATSTTKLSKKKTPLAVEETPKPSRRTKSSIVSKVQAEDGESTPKVPKKIIKTLSAKTVLKTNSTPTVSKKITKSLSEKAISKKDTVSTSVSKKVVKEKKDSNVAAERSTSLLNATPKISRLSRKSMPLIKDTPTNNKTAPSRSASTGKTNTKVASEKAKKNVPLAEENPKSSSKGKKKDTVSENSTSPSTESAPKKGRGRPRKSVARNEDTPNVPSTVSKEKKNTKAASEKSTLSAKSTSKTAAKALSNIDTPSNEDAPKKGRGRPRKSLPADETTTSSNKAKSLSRKSVA